MAFWSWAKTAASNATADSTVNWAEGMPPSAVNDSARAMMARLAEYRDDVSGALATSGSSSAYTLTSNQGFDSLVHMSNAVIAFTPHTTNVQDATINVDSLGAKPVRPASSTTLFSGVLIAGTPYRATYNNTTGEWILNGFHGNVYGTPLGGGLHFLGDTAPNSIFALPYGQPVSRTTYATLWNLIGSRFGSGDGTSTFNLPDVRGRFIAYLDSLGGSAASRLTTGGSGMDGSVIGAVGGAQNQTLTIAQLPVITPAGTVSVSTPTGSIASFTPTGSVSVSNPTGSISSFTPSGSVTVSTPTGSISTITPSGSVATAANQSGLVYGLNSVNILGTPGSGSTYTASNNSAGTVNLNPSFSSTFTGNAVTPTFSGGAASGSFAGNSVTPTFSGGALSSSFTGNSIAPTFTGNAASGSFSGSSFGSGNAHPIVPPTIVLGCIFRIL